MKGKDIFYFVLTPNDIESSYYGKNLKKGRLYIYGQGFDRNYLKTSGYPCAKQGSLTGQYCGALIFLDGWQISKDYPW